MAIAGLAVFNDFKDFESDICMIDEDTQTKIEISDSACKMSNDSGFIELSKSGEVNINGHLTVSKK